MIKVNVHVHIKVLGFQLKRTHSRYLFLSIASQLKIFVNLSEGAEPNQHTVVGLLFSSGIKTKREV